VRAGGRGNLRRLLRRRELHFEYFNDFFKLGSILIELSNYF
jgi:hypothetical protein